MGAGAGLRIGYSNKKWDIVKKANYTTNTKLILAVLICFILVTMNRAKI